MTKPERDAKPERDDETTKQERDDETARQKRERDNEENDGHGKEMMATTSIK